MGVSEVFLTFISIGYGHYLILCCVHNTHVYLHFIHTFIYTLTYRYFLVWAIGSLLKVLRANLVVTKESRLALSSLGLSTPVADNKEKGDSFGELEPGKCSPLSSIISLVTFIVLRS